MKKNYTLALLSLTLLSGVFAQETLDLDKLTTTITVDGDTTDWNAIAPNYFVDITGETFVDAADFTAIWKGAWDSAGIYILVNITSDDSILTQGAAGNFWERDLIEIYFDMNIGNLDDGGGPSDDAGHRQFVTDIRDYSWKGLQDTVADYGHVLGADSASSVSEYFIPWTALTNADGDYYIPGNTMTFGFDITLSDNDGDGGSPVRNRKVWSNTDAAASENWGNMDAAGEVTLVGGDTLYYVYVDPTGGNTSISSALSSEVVSFSPNPASNVLNVSSELNGTLSFLDLTGSVVLSTSINAGNQLVNVSNLNSGVYIAKLTSGSNSYVQKIIVK